MTIQLVSPSAYLCFEPFWKQRPKFARTFLTNIVTSVTIDEQRNSLRTIARKKISYVVQTKNIAETSYLRRYLMKYKHEVWGVPIWVYDMEFASAVAGGATVLNVNGTADRGLSNGDTIIIVGGYNNYETGTIDSFTATSITLTSGVASAWPAGKKVYPLLNAELASAVNLSPPTPKLTTIGLEFTQSFRCDDI